MKLQTQRHGRALAIRALRHLAKKGTEACRADRSSRYTTQASSLLRAIVLLQGAAPPAVQGFASILTDAVAVRRFCGLQDLTGLYERMEHERRYRQHY